MLKVFKYVKRVFAAIYDFDKQLHFKFLFLVFLMLVKNYNLNTLKNSFIENYDSMILFMLKIKLHTYMLIQGFQFQKKYEHKFKWGLNFFVLDQTWNNSKKEKL